jgi:aerotaxis receptor
MAFPPMQPAADATVAREHQYHGGFGRTVMISEREIPYPEGRLIISRTDLNGVLTHANEAFVELSGYTHDELIGQPHNILRHPDMPRAAFKDLWDTVSAGKKWHGYVKNLRKDGSFYWVYATAVPNVRGGKIVGYTSVRRKPSRNKIAEISATYKEWLAAEGSAV